MRRAFFLQRALSRNVTLSTDNVVDLVSQSADELKPLGHQIVCHTFHQTSILVQIRIQGFRSVDVSEVIVVEFRRIRHDTPVGSISRSTLWGNKGLLCLRCKVHKFNSFLLHGDMTPALKSVGPGP